MGNIFKILEIIILNILTVIKSPSLIIISIVLYIQYKKLSKLEKQILGRNKESIFYRIVTSIIFGIIGGVIGSLVIMLLGVTIEIKDFNYALLVSIVLMLIDQRFVCFAYSGGLIGIVSLLTGKLNVNIPSLMAVVGILHLVESFLVLIDGDRIKIPMFLEKKGVVVGAFNMARYWPIPITMLLAISQGINNNFVDMPSWWPLFAKQEVSSYINEISYAITGVVAILGYGDNTITKDCKTKKRKISKDLFLFSLSLILLSIIAIKIYIFKYIVVLFAPIAHEIIIRKNNREELNKDPFFTPTTRGVRVLDILPNSVGEKLGIKSGNVIVSMNGKNINSKVDIIEILSRFPTSIFISYYNNNGKIVSQIYKNSKRGVSDLGILIVPQNSNIVFKLQDKTTIQKIFTKIKGSFNI
ncbi:PDZ/DHR/GLGF domain-containing protein [Gottschalkia purinilytica]|uniref:PDZ/DHR/GLGF domain-containing protein n=1 Tax=Gottschalkia purinilytica TaxID=1503 RepID=A0A0L0WCH2_GOTPU|nr:PDZ domain-containing protein [Gottschalkia purinilytica]KNF09161.1 PDZ/DHR/GLGF domain-containing protein [Gottschalkia purinilytica]